MSPPSRRDALAGAGSLALAALGGCQGATDAPGATGSDTPTAVDAGTWVSTDDGREIRVTAPAVRRSVVTVETVSSTHEYEVVATPPEGQYLVASVSTRGFDAEPFDLPLTVAVDGEPGRERSVTRVGRESLDARDRLGFHLPAVEASRAAVVWDRSDGAAVRWRLGARVRERLAAVPSFSVESVSVPDRVAPGETFTGSFTVRNDGGRDGRFLTTFGLQEGSLPVPETAVRVPTGETVTHEKRLRPQTEAADSYRVVVDWGRERRDATVTVDRSTATATGTGDG